MTVVLNKLVQLVAVFHDYSVETTTTALFREQAVSTTSVKYPVAVVMMPNVVHSKPVLPEHVFRLHLVFVIGMMTVRLSWFVNLGFVFHDKVVRGIMTVLVAKFVKTQPVYQSKVDVA